MRPMAKLLVGALLVALPASGCQPISFETSRQIHGATIIPFTIDAPKHDQSIQVTVTSPGVPVTVYVVLQKDSDTVEQAIFGSKKMDPAKILASKENQEETNLEAKIPAGNEYTVLVYNASRKTADVKLKIKGS